MKKFILTIFLISSSIGTSYAQGESDSCYENLTSITTKQALSGAYVIGMFIPSLVAGGTIGSMFGAPGAALGSSSVYQARQTYLMKALYDEGLVEYGPLLNELYNNVLPEIDRTEEEENVIRKMYMERIENGTICSRLENSDSYTLFDISQEILSDLKN